MSDIVIIHGTMGNPEGNWFPWLSSQLKKQGHHVYVPHFPTPDGQTADAWCGVLRDQAPVFDENTILIGHSIGATFLLHILATLVQPVKASFFISPVMGVINNAEYDTLNASFIAPDWQWNQLRSVAGWTGIMHGLDDPYVPMAHPKILAKGLNIGVNWVENGGHLNAESGYTQFSELLDKLTAIT